MIVLQVNLLGAFDSFSSISSKSNSKSFELNCILGETFHLLAFFKLIPSDFKTFESSFASSKKEFFPKYNFLCVCFSSTKVIPASFYLKLFEVFVQFIRCKIFSIIFDRLNITNYLNQVKMGVPRLAFVLISDRKETLLQTGYYRYILFDKSEINGQVLPEKTL